MKEIAEYEIIKAKNHEDLVQQVREWLESGWQIHGSPYCDRLDHHFQAMVRVKLNSNFRVSTIN